MDPTVLAVLSLVLLVLSEAIGMFPKLKENSILQLAVRVLTAIVPKK